MSSQNTFQQSKQAYTNSTGTSGTGRNLVMTRNPTVNDVNYAIGTFWQNTANESLWYLNSQTSTGAVLQSDWINIESSLATLSDTADTPVSPSSGLTTPPNNIQLINLDGSITILSDPPNNRIIFGLAGGSTAIDSIAVQASTPPGTNPVLPTGTGLVTMNGSVVAAGTNPIRTNSIAANTLAVQVQISQAIAATDVTKIGLSNFNSAHFTVDANGFVGLLGGGQAVDSFAPDTGTNPVVPNASGLVNVKGQTVPSTSGIRVTGALNEIDIAMFSPFAGGFVFTTANSGGNVDVQVANTSNTAASQANFVATCGGASALWASTIYQISGGSNYYVGILASDGSFRISPSGIGTNDKLTITQAGVITFDNAYSFPTADGTAGQVLTTDGAGHLTFQSSGAGTWSVIGASQTLSVNHGYICTTGAGLSLALPATSAVGDTIEVSLDGSTSWTITQPNAGTQIRIGSTQTTLGVGGSLASTAVGDSIKLVCETANARWVVTSMVGNISFV